MWGSKKKWGAGDANERPGTENVTSGLKKTANDDADRQTDKHTQRRTSLFYD